ELTTDEQVLYNILKKLAKQANQRMLRAERLTGYRENMASKDLTDLLSSSEGLTKTGRVKVSKSMTLQQMEDSITALEKYISDKTSKISGLKEVKQKIEKDYFKGEKISWEQAIAMYHTFYKYTWIYDYMSASEFWTDYGNPARFHQISKTEFVESLKIRIQKTDTIYQTALEELYDYCSGGV
ncbi:MAG: hypothetical protein U0K92_07565, partial [Treponema sp.]|nr:hypothetical protein [Treponema sp.]